MKSSTPAQSKAQTLSLELQQDFETILALHQELANFLEWQAKIIQFGRKGASASKPVISAYPHHCMCNLPQNHSAAKMLPTFMRCELNEITWQAELNLQAVSC